MQKKTERKKTPDLSRLQAFYLTLLIFSISILLRIPGLTRPISKHHEFITAVILIGVESWQQAGGAANFHYTPLMNYQNPGDRINEKEVNIDSKGNTLYLSLGPGWYILPYAFFRLFHLPVIPLYLRILNLIIHGIVVIVSFFFFEQLIPAGTNKRFSRIFAATVLFMFTPGLLWFLGNVYVHATAMLPFLIIMLMILLPMLGSPEKIRTTPLLLLALMVILCVYMDLFILFLCLSTCTLTLLLARKDKKYLLLTGVLLFSLSIGVALICWQFASYTSLATVAEYWKRRFLERSFVNKEDSLPANLLSISGNLITAFLPILLFLLVAFIINRIKKIRLGFSPEETRFAVVYAAALGLNFLVLANFAARHDYSTVPAGLLLAWLGGRLLPITTNYKVPVAFICIFLIFSTAQYYFINRPGPIAHNGTPYNTYQVFGERLRHLPPNYKIFANLPESCPMIEYYAGRNITLAQDTAEAKQQMRNWNIDTAIWVECEGFQYKGTRTINAPAGNKQTKSPPGQSTTP